MEDDLGEVLARPGNGCGTPALHMPLFSLTNAISSVIVVGAIVAAVAPVVNFGSVLGVIAVGRTSINFVGGFLVAQRVLEMFKSTHRKTPGDR